jgi:hypothetical protein
MAVPQASLRVGAAWGDAGAVGDGLDERFLRVSESYSSLDRLNESETSLRFKTAVLQYVDGSVSTATSARARVHIEKVEVVGVADPGKLTLTQGARYIWEGIRVSKFTVTDVDTTSHAAEMSIKSLSPLASVSVTGSSATRRQLVVDGSHLYIAYRVVEFRRLGGEGFHNEVAWKPGKTWSTGTWRSSGPIGASHSISFQFYDDAAVGEKAVGDAGETEFVGGDFAEPIRADLSCKILTTITFHDELNAQTGQPKRRKWRTHCYQRKKFPTLISDVAIPISTRSDGGRYIVEYLTLDITDFDERTDRFQWVEGSFAVDRNVYGFVPVDIAQAL